MNMNKIPLVVLLSWKLFFFDVADEVETCVQSSIPVLYQDKFYICIHRQDAKQSTTSFCVKYETSSTENLRKYNDY
jgi:hypothetical protein